MLVVDGVLYNESRSTLAALLALVVVGRAFSRVSPALLARFASLGQAAVSSCYLSLHTQLLLLAYTLSQRHTIAQ